ncbi:hypothetical protein Chor_004968, partial [Crotalus horridus]
AQLHLLHQETERHHRGSSPNPADKEEEMRDTVNSQYGSFLYWRMPIPELDVSELECLGLADLALFKPKRGYGSLVSEQKTPRPNLGGPEEAESALLPFSSFNFWRAPIASINPGDFDLI